MDDGGGWWCYGGGGWWMKCERGGVPRDEMEWNQALLFIGWTEGWARPRVRWTRPRARLTLSLLINCNSQLQLMRLLYFLHAPVPAGHGPVVGNGSFYKFVFYAASWARPRAGWARGVFRLLLSLLCLRGCRWGSGQSTFIPFLVFMLELVVFLLLLWFWAHFILKIQKEDKNTLFPTLVLKKGLVLCLNWCDLYVAFYTHQIPPHLNFCLSSSKTLLMWLTFPNGIGRREVF